MAERTSADTRIRPLRAEDARGLAEVHMQAFRGYRSTRLGPGYVRAVYRWFARDPDAFGVVAEREGELAGFVAGCREGYGRSQARALWPRVLAAVTRRPWVVLDRAMLRAVTYRIRGLARPPHRGDDSSPREVAVLLSIAVAPEHRGHGVGGRLMEAFEEEARGRGFANLRLSVFRSNVAATRLYERAGWRVDPNGPYPDAHVFRKQVGPSGNGADRTEPRKE